MSSLPMMTDTDFSRCEMVADESGFGAMQTEKGNLPLKELAVDTSIIGLVATTTMRQTFVNNHNQPLETTYIFPLPDRAAVVSFKMIVADRVIDGVLKERGEARREYREAIEKGHRASIVEEDRPDTFNMRVGNILPGEEATIEITTVGPLVYAGGEATFRFPLVVAPRYIPGSPLAGASVGVGTSSDTDAVPDASRITPPVLLPGFPNPVKLRINLSIDTTQLEIGELKSSLHAVRSTKSKGTILISIEPGEKVNRDFILRFGVAADQVTTKVVAVPDKEGKEGTFLLTVIPPKPSGERRARDISFVLDRSGSMQGWKMVAARRAVGRMLDSLNVGDRFQVLAFDNSIEENPVGTGLIEATNRNRYRTIEWLSKIEARGGTDIDKPLFKAIESVNGEAGRDRSVILITDGQVGNERQIIKGAAKRTEGSTRIFTVGIDRAVNAGFLNRLADIGGGRCELVESEGRLDEVMDRLHQTIDSPVITELNLSLKGATLVPSTLTPRRASALFPESPLVLSGRYFGESDFVAKLTGANRDGSMFGEETKAQKVDDPRLASVWARSQVRALEDQHAILDYEPERKQKLESKIISTSLKFGVMCRFTSFVAVDRSESIDSDSKLHKVVQPVESPDGWKEEALSGYAPMQQMRPTPAPSSSAYAQAPSGGSARGRKKMARPSMVSASVDGVQGFGSADAGAFDEVEISDVPQEAMSFDSIVSEEKQARVMGRSSVAKGAVSQPLPVDVLFLAFVLFELMTGKRHLHEDATIEEALRTFTLADLESNKAKLGGFFDLLNRTLCESDIRTVAEFLQELTNIVASEPTSTLPDFAQELGEQSLLALCNHVQALEGVSIDLAASIIEQIGAALASQPDTVLGYDEFVMHDGRFVRLARTKEGMIQKLASWVKGETREGFWK